MTDKQIIIDGIEVKDCIAYAKSQTVYLGNTVYKQMEKICMVKNQPCKFFDCQFKQMARELKAKEQECEAYKMEAEEGKEINAELKLENKHLNDLLNQALKELEKTRETLTEIKEIAEKRNYLDYNECLDDILQKISEVEE